MNRAKKTLLFTGLILLIAASSCGDDDITRVPTVNERYAEDLEEIEAYIAEKGYQNVDTTESGIRYVILEEGSGPQIAVGDIVALHFTGRLTDGFVFDTSIDTVGQANDFDSLETYTPIILSHTTNGWPLNDVYIDGFRDGVAATFNRMNLGGQAVIMIPSRSGFQSGSGLAGLVTVFELYPTEIK